MTDSKQICELIETKPIVIGKFRFYDVFKQYRRPLPCWVPCVAISTEDVARAFECLIGDGNVDWETLKRLLCWQRNEPTIGNFSDIVLLSAVAIRKNPKYASQKSPKPFKIRVRIEKAWDKAQEIVDKRYAAKKQLRIYVFLFDNGVVKIGISNDVNKRAAMLNQASAVVKAYYTRKDFIADKAREIEKTLHTRFAGKRKYQSNGSPEYFINLPFETACDALKEYSDLIRLEVNHENHSPCLEKLQETW